MVENIEKKVENLICGIIKKLGYDLYDVKYLKEGKNYFLRIYIDSDKGINLNDCEKVSNNVTELLDREDYIKEKYFLEVSSPGIERVLRKDEHFKMNIGHEVKVKLFKLLNGEKQYKGILRNFDNNVITIMTRANKELSIDRKNISQIKTVYNW